MQSNNEHETRQSGLMSGVRVRVRVRARARVSKTASTSRCRQLLIHIRLD